MPDHAKPPHRPADLMHAGLLLQGKADELAKLPISGAGPTDAERLLRRGGLMLQDLARWLGAH